MKKLGFGAFSTVWLALNIKDRKLYALKVMRSADKYTKASFIEEEINRLVAESHSNPAWLDSIKHYIGRAGTRDDTHCLQMHDWFFHHGANGRHFVMCFEVLGKNLLTLIQRY